MKTTLKLGSSIILGLMAQIQAPAGVAASTSDTIVQLMADEHGLQAVSYTSLPLRGGTYWEILPGGLSAPLPEPLFDTTLPIYTITSNIFLVDVTYGQLVVNPRQTAGMSSADALTFAADAEATRVANLINMVQTATAQTTAALASSAAVSSSASASVGTSIGFSANAQTQQQSGVPYLLIAPAGTNQFLITVLNDQGPANYEIWTTPTLENPSWSMVGNPGIPGQTNFTVNTSVYYTGFFRALQDTNAIPLWEAANPTNQALGVLSVVIDSPANGSSLTQ